PKRGCPPRAIAGTMAGDRRAPRSGRTATAAKSSRESQPMEDRRMSAYRRKKRGHWSTFNTTAVEAELAAVELRVDAGTHADDAPAQHRTVVIHPPPRLERRPMHSARLSRPPRGTSPSPEPE